MMVLRGHGARRGQWRGAIAGGNIWWVAPSYGIANEIWRDLKRACRGAWESKSEVERRIQLHGAGSVTVKSADNPDSLVGTGLDGVVIDEAARVKQDAWTYSLRPALSDRQGWAVFITTPKGFNWLHDLYQNAAGNGWARWQRPSSENPLITAAEMEATRRDIGSVAYAQEHDAKFTRQGLGMFQRPWLPIVDASPAKGKRVRWWDKAYSKGRGDFSAGVKLLRSPDGVYYVENVIRGQWSPREREVVIEQTAELDELAHGRITIWIEEEPAAGKETAELTIRRLAGYDVHAERTSGDKMAMAAPFAAQCEAGNVRLVRGAWNADFIDELCEFPAGRNDDQVDGASRAFRKLALKPGTALYRGA